MESPHTPIIPHSSGWTFAMITLPLLVPLLFLSLLLLFILERYLTYRKLCQKYSHLPGYTQFCPPVVASWLPSFLLPHGTLTNPTGYFLMEKIKQSMKEFKTDYYKVIIFTTPMVVISNPEMGKEISLKGTKMYRKKPHSKRSFIELFKGSNVFAEDEHAAWAHQRHLIEPGFSPESLKMVSHVTSECIQQEMIPHLNANLEKRDVMSDFAKLTMNVIGSAGFSYNFDSFCMTAQSPNLEQKTNFFLHYIDTLRLLPTRFLRQHLKVGLFAKLHDSVQSFRKVILDIIQHREQQDENGQEEDDKSDILSLLLRERKISGKQGGGSLTDSELVSNAFILLVAGHETTARTLGFALYLLCKNPHIQQELHHFVDRFCEENQKETFDYEDFTSGRLDYLKAVFKETLRLYPVAMGVIRECVKSFEWKKQNIPKGSLVFYSWIMSMSSEEYWEEPEQFKPIRFLKKENNHHDEKDPTKGTVYNPQSNPFVYTPFGIGGRICIGKHFAEVEGIIALAYLARNYSFKLSDPNYQLEVDMRVTLRPMEPILVDFIPRRR